MVFLKIAVHEAARDEVEARVLATATSGLEDRSAEILAYYESRLDAEAAQAFLGDLNPRLIEVPDENWQAAWQAHWKAFTLGERFFLAPEWEQVPTPDDRIRLNMHSGMAFGSGDHGTTQMALLALERHLRPGQRVLDLGTGSAILLIAAVRLGAGFSVGTDNDPIALRLAHGNMRAEGLSPALVLTAGTGFQSAGFDIVIANISPHAAVSFAPEIKRLLRKGGRVFVGGFGADGVAPASEAYRATGLAVETVEARAEWRMLITRPAR